MCLKKLFFCLTLGYIIMYLLCLFVILLTEILLQLKTNEVTKVFCSQVACTHTYLPMHMSYESGLYLDYIP